MHKPYAVNLTGVGLHQIAPVSQSGRILAELDLQVKCDQATIFIFVAVNEDGAACTETGSVVQSPADAFIVRGEVQAGNMQNILRNGSLGRIPPGCGLALWLKGAGSVCGSLALADDTNVYP